MRQTSWPAKEPAEQVVSDIVRATRLRGGTASPSSVGVKASPRRCLTAGPRSSWKPARSGWRETWSPHDLASASTIFSRGLASASLEGVGKSSSAIVSHCDRHVRHRECRVCE